MKLGDTINVTLEDGTQITGAYEGFGQIIKDNMGQDLSIIVKRGVHNDGFDILTDCYLDDIVSVTRIPRP